MTILFAVYSVATIALFFLGLSLYVDPWVRTEKVWGARFILMCWAWPIWLVWGIKKGFMHMVKGFMHMVRCALGKIE